MALPAAPLMTPAEYLELERASPEKHEFFRGHVFAMAGGTYAHNCIVGDLLGILYAQLSGSPCGALPSDMRVKAEATGLYTYPDVTILCGSPQMEDGRRDTLLNPTLVMEVLSPSTEAYDRGAKFGHYQQIPSLLEYVLVSQDQARVEQFIRQDDQWIYRVYSGLEVVVALSSVPARLPLSAVYGRVELENVAGL